MESPHQMAISCTGEELSITTSSTILNYATVLKLTEYLVVDVHGYKRRVHSCLKHIIGTWNMRSINHSKLKTVKWEMKCLDIAVLGGCELTWTGLVSQSENSKMLYSENDRLFWFVAYTQDKTKAYNFWLVGGYWISPASWVNEI